MSVMPACSTTTTSIVAESTSSIAAKARLGRFASPPIDAIAVASVMPCKEPSRPTSVENERFMVWSVPHNGAFADDRISVAACSH